MTDRLITLHDGRHLGLTGLGDPAVERIVVFCHPAPGAGGFDPDPAVTNAWGVHVVGLDRPGYDSSTPLPPGTAPSIALRADDIAEYLNRMLEEARETGRTPLDRVGVVGWSAGGRVALALAARHPGLVDRVAVVATPAPDSAVPWIPEEDAALLQELRALPVNQAKARLRERLDQRLVGGRPSIDVLAPGEPDRATLERPGLRGRIERMLEHAAVQGTAGHADDVLAYAADDWGFDLGDVRAKTLLVYGAKDPIATSAHGRWYRKQIPHAHLTVVPRAGHLVIAEAWDRILDHVDPQHGARSDV